MTTVSLGKIAFAWKKEYNSSVTYNERDVVSLDGDAWICEADDTTGVAPGTDATKWSLFSQGARKIATTHGDVIYHNGTSLTRLPAGQIGQVLGIAANGLPAWMNPDVRSGTKVLKLPENAKGGQMDIYRRFGVVMTDDSMRLWGAGGDNNMGDGLALARALPVRPAFPPDFSGVDKLYLSYSGCNYVISKNGKLWGWGLNNATTMNGTMASGDAVAKTVPFCISDVPANSIYGKTVAAIAQQSGNQQYTTLMILCTDGTLHACGRNEYGQVGDGTTAVKLNTVQIMTDVAKVVGGAERYGFFLALKADGTIWTWGYNAYGQCGDGLVAAVTTPKQIVQGSIVGKTITKIFANGYSAFAIDSTGALHAWGYNNYGQLGNGNTTNQLVPVQVATDVVEVAMNGYDYQFALIRKTDGSVWAAGAGNSYGNPTAAGAASSTFIQIAGVANAVKIVAAGTGGNNRGAALLSNGRVAVWGSNAVGALGVGDVANRTTVDIALTGNRIVIDVCPVGTAAEAGLAFLMDDGSLLMSGSGYCNGDPLSQNSSVPSPVIM